MTKRRRVALGTPLPPTADPPHEFRIWPFGEIRTTKGTFLFDEAAAKSVIATYVEYGNRLTIDYEHKAVDPNRRAGDGKAAGSFRLELRDDGLYAVDVRWTPPAAEALSNKEWLYFSPCFNADEDSGRILELINVALTNIPATKSMTPLVVAHRGMHSMDEETKEHEETTSAEPARDEATKTSKLRAARARAAKLRAALAEAEEECAGLSDDDDEEETIPPGEEALSETEEDDEPPPEAASQAPPTTTSLSRRSSRVSKIEAAARAATGKSDDEEVIGALTALAKANASNVSLSRRVADLEKKLRKSEVEAMVTRAIKTGKLAPVEREWALSYGMDNPGKLRGYLDVTPARATVAASAEAHREPAPHGSANARGSVALSADELRICENTGINPEKLAAVKHRAIRFGGG